MTLSARPRNDRSLLLSALCLELERWRRTEEGRIRSADDFAAFFFPRDGDARVDRVLVHMPAPVRAPILAGWRIRGLRSALRDDDERVRSVVEDAFEAEDLDPAAFEAGIDPQTLVDWVPLGDFWRFFRGRLLPAPALKKVLSAARELRILDDDWFLQNIALRDGARGVDVVATLMSKEDVVGWLGAIASRGGRASSASLVAAAGWDAILVGAPEDALRDLVDALARRENLVSDPSRPPPRDTSLPRLNGNRSRL